MYTILNANILKLDRLTVYKKLLTSYVLSIFLCLSSHHTHCEKFDYIRFFSENKQYALTQ